VATIKYEGNEIRVAEDWRLGELIEAENAMGVDMETARGGAKMALVLYISIRRAKPELPADGLANIVRHMEITSVVADDDEAEELPLGEGTNGAAGETSETEELPTGGRLRSAS
jgi:hypothetical protein